MQQGVSDGLGMADIWGRVLQVMESELRKPSFDTWLKSTRPVELFDNTLVVAVQNTFAQQWIESRYMPLILSALREAAGRPLDVRFVTPDAHQEVAAAAYRPDTVQPLAADPPPRDPAAPPSGADGPSPSGKDGRPPLYLNPKYTFESFVVGDSNRLAHAAALAVAESPARAYNPLFIYGGVGLGKTHLMQAIGHYVARYSPDLVVLYVSSETFTNELINAIRDDKTIEFKRRYRNIDVLLIDDIQFLAGKERTQEEFFHTFEALHGANRQIVISSDRPPKDIPTLEERLRSRFEWGLLADIQPPDLETRVAILRKKAQTEGLCIPDDVIMHVASRIDTNIRELEGALIRIVASSSLENQPITLEFAVEALRDILPEKKGVRAATIADIQALVARHYSLSVDDLKSDSRVRRVAFPRQIAMYLCRELTNHSLPKIGEEFGGRDHTTVLHACEKITKERTQNPDLDEQLKNLLSALRELPA